MAQRNPESFILHGENRSGEKPRLSDIEQRFFALSEYLYNNFRDVIEDVTSISDVYGMIVNMYKEKKKEHPDLDFENLLTFLEAEKIGWVRKVKQERSEHIIQELSDAIEAEALSGGFLAEPGFDKSEYSRQVDEFLDSVGGYSVVATKSRLVGLSDVEELSN